MQTVFSHIIQRRFSKVSENVATDALVYILESSEAARNGMLKLLRGIEPGLPSVRFKTQQVEGAIRPDMWGYSEGEPRVFIENKFWAGLTDNQPVSYLKQLNNYSKPSLLLVVAPAARERTLWRELKRRMEKEKIQFTERGLGAGEIYSAETDLGPRLAITSWEKVLLMMELEASGDTHALGNLVQLKSLCAASEMSAFRPFQASDTSNQLIPDLIGQLNGVALAVVDHLVAESVLNLNNLRPQASSERIGRYARFSYPSGSGVTFWIGVHFELWKAYGATPLWITFFDDGYERGRDAQSIIEPWASGRGVLTRKLGSNFCLALELLCGEEKSSVVENLAGQIRDVSQILSGLKPKIQGPPAKEIQSAPEETDPGS